jgi:hypothetical protein
MELQRAKGTKSEAYMKANGIEDRGQMTLW